jgi:hypothetical protein
MLQALARAPWLGQLTELNLSHAWINDSSLETLARLADLGQLESLDLTCARLEDGDAAGRFFNRPPLGRLRQLRLAGSSYYGGGTVSASCLAALADSPHMGELRELSLTRCPLPAGGLAPLANSRSLNRLEGLDLSCALGSDADMLALARGTGLPALTTLRLDSCGIIEPTDGYYSTQLQVSLPAFTAFLRSPILARLRRLSLNSNHLGQPGAEALASSPCLGGLHELDLGGCELPAPALRRLLASSALRGLRYLWLWGNTVDDDVAQAILTGLPDLRELRIDQRSYSQPPLAEEVLQALRERFGHACC